MCGGRKALASTLSPKTTDFSDTTVFIPEEKPPKLPTTRREANFWDTVWDWKILVDLDQKFIFPPEIMTTNFRPNRVLCSTSQRSLCSVPWEAAVSETYKQKRLKSTHIALKLGCRGFVAKSTTEPPERDRSLRAGPATSHQIIVGGHWV